MCSWLYKVQRIYVYGLSVSTLLETVPRQQDQSKHQEYVIRSENFVLKIRPLTGADQELILGENEDNSNNSDWRHFSKAEQLIRSCIISSDPPLSSDTFNENLLEMISSKLEEIDPRADLILDLECPSCQFSFQTPFKAEDFLFREIDARKQQLEREVHWIAFYYHWSEDAILSLPIRKRKRYVDLINKTLGGEQI